MIIHYNCTIGIYKSVLCDLGICFLSTASDGGGGGGGGHGGGGGGGGGQPQH